MFASNDRESHTNRCVTILLLVILIASALSWASRASAQPMCPLDQIWDEEAEDCVPLTPTETPTETMEAVEATEPPVATETDVPDDEGMTETPTETLTGDEASEDTDDVVTPEMVEPTPTDADGAQFSIFGWDPFGFEGKDPNGLMFVYSCNRPVNAGDTFDSLMPDCWFVSDISAAMGFNIYVNGQYRETVAAGGGPYLNDTLPAGEVGIQAFYPDDFQAPWVDCHVYYIDDDDFVTTYLYPWVPQGRAMVTMPVETPNSRVACIWFFSSNEVMAVDAYAYTCPAYVTDQTIQYNDLLGRCPASSETEVQILSDGGVQNRMANMGWAPFRNVPLGTVHIRGFPPAGYGDPLVYCMVTGPGGQTTKGLDLELIGNQGYVTIEHTLPGGIVRCDLFYRET